MLRFLLLSSVLVLIRAEDELQVTVKQGIVRGRLATSRNGLQFVSFEGIPYAKPPLGDLRFRSPQPPEKWNGVLDATKPVPVCVQKNIFAGIKEPYGQEDCLFINVYTPKVKEHSLLDVMVWVHGGGWIVGSGNTYHPEFLMDKDIVLVSFNYRLGPLGFLSTGDAASPGNNGLKDHVAALRWVRDNIAAFGGNPGSVTIFGESAGGAGVHYLTLSPLSRGLFHRAISQSGTALCPWAYAPQGSSTQQTRKLAELLDCPTQNSDELVTCLRGKDAKDITATDEAFIEWSIYPLVTFQPVLETGDDAFLPASPLQLIQNVTIVPWITGVTSEEGAFPVSKFDGDGLTDEFYADFDRLLPISISYHTSPLKDETTRRIREFYFQKNDGDNQSALINLFSDSWFLHGADRAVELHSARPGAAPVYYYYFNYRGARSFTSVFGASDKDYGVAHGDDLLYLFPTDFIADSMNLNENDAKMVDTMTSLWREFARSGDPTPTPYNGVKWQRSSSSGSKAYLKIDSKGLKMEHGLLRERMEFWKSLQFGIFSSATTKDEL